MHRARVRTLQALVAGTQCLAAHPQHSAIQAEFSEVYAVRRIRRSARRRLLEVLHSTRALDTTLAAFVTHHGCRMSNGKVPKALGQYLYALRDHSVGGLGTLAEAHRKQFQTGITNRRNRYMHEAFAFPVTDVEVRSLLAEMDNCLTVVTRL